MNIERLTRVRNHIAEHPDEFNMESWPLSTSKLLVARRCIGATVIFLLVKDGEISLEGWHDDHTANKWLGLDVETARDLFCMRNLGRENQYYWPHVTADDAVRAIDTLIETGKVDWSHVTNRVEELV